MKRVSEITLSRFSKELMERLPASLGVSISHRGFTLNGVDVVPYENNSVNAFVRVLSTIVDYLEMDLPEVLEKTDNCLISEAHRLVIEWRLKNG